MKFLKLFFLNLLTASLRIKWFVRFADLPQMWHFANLRFAEPIVFANNYLFIYLLLPQVRKNKLFLSHEKFADLRTCTP